MGDGSPPMGSSGEAQLSMLEKKLLSLQIHITLNAQTDRF